MKENTIPIEELEKLMKGHDWYYGHRTDGVTDAWREGSERQSAITWACRELPPEVAAALWLKYCPKDLIPSEFQMENVA